MRTSRDRGALVPVTWGHADPGTLFDDDELVRRGLRDLLGDEPDIEVVAEAGSVEEALAVAMHVQPEVAWSTSASATATASRSAASCGPAESAGRPTLTAFDDEEAMVGAIMAGAAGHLLKQVRGQDVVYAVREVAAGRSLLDPVSMVRCWTRCGTRRRTTWQTLTERERDVLELIGQGRRNREIAERLFLAEKTVKTYATSALANSACSAGRRPPPGSRERVK